MAMAILILSGGTRLVGLGSGSWQDPSKTTALPGIPAGWLRPGAGLAVADHRGTNIRRIADNELFSNIVRQHLKFEPAVAGTDSQKLILSYALTNGLELHRDG